MRMTTLLKDPEPTSFTKKDEVLYTCPTGNILPGITRATMFELAQILDYKIEEKHFTIADVKGSDGAFFVGTAAEVTGIKTLDKEPFALEWEDTMGYELSKMYQRRVAHNEFTNFALV